MGFAKISPVYDCLRGQYVFSLSCSIVDNLTNLINWFLFNWQFGQPIFGKKVICSFKIVQLDLFSCPLSSQPTTYEDIQNSAIEDVMNIKSTITELYFIKNP